MSGDDRPWSKWATRANLVLFLVLAGCSGGGAGSVGNTAQLPNIVLVVMDDIGIDQWQLFGYGGVDPAATPNIDAIANGGVSFHNMWGDASVLQWASCPVHRPLSVLAGCHRRSLIDRYYRRRRISLGDLVVRFRPRCRSRRRGHRRVLRGRRHLLGSQQDRRGSSGPSVQGFRRNLRSEPTVHRPAPRLYQLFDPQRTLCFAAGDQQ
jgi:hypothetical protein